MTLFLLALVLFVAAAALLVAPDAAGSKALGRLAGIVCLLVGIGSVLLASAVFIDDDKGGVVVRTLGDDLPTNRVVAINGEKGPQAEVLGPGWHFGYWPWAYSVSLVDTITIQQGKVGVIVALDGKPLTVGQVFADAWTSSEELLDGKRFLTSGQGQRGPQLTILAPGRYRYNPRLFDIKAKDALVVHIGEVAVIKANAGPEYKPPADAEIINGTPLVPRGHFGLWREALLPGAYNLHPDAYQVVRVATTKRIYTYQDDKWAIRVRSKDGFSFPVDVRVAVEVTAEDAPRLAAILADPDKVVKDLQEDEPLPLIESKVVLPLIRTTFRDVAETMSALQFIDSRSSVEAEATKRMREELKHYHLRTDGVFVANIELDTTDAGKALIATQTDRVVAVNQQQMFSEKKRAEETRATFIKAQEEAEQQRQLAAASYQVLVKEQQAKAREAEANGEARYITITAQARTEAYRSLAGAIGAQGVTTLELLKAVSEGKIQITPQVMVTGSGGGTGDALAGTILGRMLAPTASEAAPAAPVSTPKR